MMCKKHGVGEGEEEPTKKKKKKKKKKKHFLLALFLVYVLKFKRLNLAKKALVLNFVPDPWLRGERVPVRAPCTDPEIFFTRYSLKFLVTHFS